ncbi:MAG: type II toxin-antitoxin system RelE/ParE family toxin [Bacteroidota bacterium]|jgi:plasmid stabilization system protein ParE|nr:type II toxin-antitoxin system RelE/ParE family toxin [Cytophagales bacterium]MCZ8072395.1 type II toxin-antitoxin system RelE/ParE family toxin [Cytophagales bacterium]
MAKKVEWTESAVNDRLEILKFWREHNQSDVFSLKLEILFNNAADLIAEFPKSGLATDFPNVRVKIVRSFKVFYIVDPDSIVILRIYDARRDPKGLSLS